MLVDEIYYIVVIAHNVRLCAIITLLLFKSSSIISVMENQTEKIEGTNQNFTVVAAIKPFFSQNPGCFHTTDRLSLSKRQFLPN